MAEHMEKLSDESLSNVAGGYVYFNYEGGSTPYELIDDFTGDTLGAFSSRQDCLNSARINNMSTREITRSELEALRRR